MNEKIIVFKNEKIGDLIHSISAINYLINKNPTKEIVIYLSEYNQDMSFLFRYNNTNIRIISEKVSLKDKFNIFLSFLKENVKEVYIFKPSYFLFLLPILFLFKNINFYGVCVKKKNYFRPNKFLRRFLEYYVINDRGTNKIRKSIYNLNMNLVKQNDEKYIDFSFIKKKLMSKEKYLLIHYNKFKFEQLGWSLKDLILLKEKIINLSYYVVLTNDIGDHNANSVISEKFSNNKFFKHYVNIKGEKFFDLIGKASLVISMHGSITSIATFQDTKVIDLFNCDIKKKKDIYKYKNAFHEFKPNKNNYEFLIPRKNANKTFDRIIKLLKYGRKINY